MSHGTKVLRVEDALSAIASAPGPSPWFLRASSASLRNAKGPLFWVDAGAKEPLAQKSVLRDESGLALAVLGFYCYVEVLDGRHFLLWHPERERSSTSGMRLSLIDADQLSRIADLVDQCNLMSAGGLPAFVSGGVLASTCVGDVMDVGEYEHDFPPALRHVREILVLAPSPELRLLVLRPHVNRVEVIPQDWFNQGDFDFGYQWVTRVAREPKTGSIVGEGMRMGVFQLDESGRQVSRWLIEDRFYLR